VASILTPGFAHLNLCAWILKNQGVAEKVFVKLCCQKNAGQCSAIRSASSAVSRVSEPGFRTHAATACRFGNPRHSRFGKPARYGGLISTSFSERPQVHWCMAPIPNWRILRLSIPWATKTLPLSTAAGTEFVKIKVFPWQSKNGSGDAAADFVSGIKACAVDLYGRLSILVKA